MGGKEQSGWRTLSKQEWEYLFNTRTMKNGKARYTPNIIYGGKMGLVLDPDDYDNDPISGSVETMPEGVVFLPAAGYRRGTDLYSAGSQGYFWSSSLSSTDPTDLASYLFFHSNGFLPLNSDLYYGYSVRPVKDAAAGDPGNRTEQYTNNSNPDWFSSK